MSEITVTLPDGSARTLPEGSTTTDLALSIGPRLAKDALIGVVDGAEVDLDRPLPDGSAVEIVVADSDRGLFALRHSTAHVLAQAVLELWPGATFAIGPPIENGFYYDFELPDGATFSDDDLERIDAKMREIVSADQPFVRQELTNEEGLALFEGHPYKQAIISAVGDADLATEVAEAGVVSTYRNTESFVDLCRGPHVPSTGRLGHFKLMRVAGAYWRGDEHNPMLQRIYGTAWATKKQLAEHLHRLEEAEKRDHRRLATELDLVSWNDKVGPGLALWHPKGATVRRLMEDYSRARHEQGGYQFVFTPHIGKSDLWETSGHLDFYEESMYPAMELDGATYYPKPMNCPFHMTIFKHDQHSYRDLPMRLFELGTVYRYELSGVVHGLLRSRGFTQDDSHIFCTPEQAPDEIASLLDFVLDLLRAFGFEEFQAKLSTRPEGKSVGSDDEWGAATDALRQALERQQLDYTVDEGGGAFYGPKIDVDVRDAIGRAWQLSTIQVDFQLPQRFELEYVGSDGDRHRPVVIHRALFGSIERFFGVLIEHYAGAFPTWLAPVQTRVLPVAAEHEEYAREVASRLRDAHLRVDSVEASEPLGKRIRNAKLQKIPYVLVVGDDDVADKTAGVNPRGGEVERGVPIDAILTRIESEVVQYRV
jgi:threonyl-tRNA synthetase